MEYVAVGIGPEADWLISRKMQCNSEHTSECRGFKHYKIIIAFILLSNNLKAQTFDISSIKFPGNGYVEYNLTFKPFNNYNNDSFTRSFKLWFIASKERNSITQFILSDSLETIVYLDGLVTHFINESKKKYSNFYNEQEVYSIYQNKLSHPHISPYYVYMKNIERGKLSINKMGSRSKVRIDIKYPYDTTKYKKFIITSEFDDSILLNYSLKFLKPDGDSNYSGFRYVKPVIQITKKNLDSIAEYYSDLYESFENGEVDVKSKLPLNFPSHTIININDSIMNIFDTTAKLVILDFWYIGCRPCNDAIPFLNSLNQKYSSQGLRLLAVNYYDTSATRVTKFIKNKNIQYHVALKNRNSYFNNCNVKSFPTMIIINKQGVPIYTQEGYSATDDKKVEDMIVNLLKLK